MKAAIIKDNIVINIITVKDAKYKSPDGELVISETARIGDAYKDGLFVSPPLAPVTEKNYVEKRMQEYGNAEKQLEYLIEHGLDAFQNRQQAIKDKYPKDVVDTSR